MPGEFVFGYGSLAVAGGFPARLAGHRRGWTVSADNSETVPGYKYYLSPDGSRPAVRVAFLDVRPEDVYVVNGLCVPVDASGLQSLDRRERQYDRIDVSSAITGVDGRVWTYVGSSASRALTAASRRAERLVISADYLAVVRQGFDSIDAWAEFEDSTDPIDIQVLPLARIDVPHGWVRPRAADHDERR